MTGLKSALVIGALLLGISASIYLATITTSVPANTSFSGGTPTATDYTYAGTTASIPYCNRSSDSQVIDLVPQVAASVVFKKVVGNYSNWVFEAASFEYGNVSSQASGMTKFARWELIFESFSQSLSTIDVCSPPIAQRTLYVIIPINPNGAWDSYNMSAMTAYSQAPEPMPPNPGS